MPSDGHGKAQPCSTRGVVRRRQVVVVDSEEEVPIDSSHKHDCTATQRVRREARFSDVCA